MNGQSFTKTMAMARKRARRSLRGKARRGQSGMTLVEIMIVVIIMAMIATAVGMAVLPQLERARIEQTRTDSQTIRSAVELYLAQNPGGDCPSVSDLVDEHMLNGNTNTQDQWGNEFIVDCESDDPVVTSNGPDGQSGTEDDVR